MDSFSESTDFQAKSLDQISLESIDFEDILNKSSEMLHSSNQKTGPIFEQFAMNLLISELKSFGVDLTYRLGWKLSYYPNEYIYREKVDAFLTLAGLQNAFQSHPDARDLESDGIFFVKDPVIKEIRGRIGERSWKITLPALVLLEISESSDEKPLNQKLWQLMRNIAILREFDIDSIIMDEGSLNLWIDDEKQQAIKNAHLLVVSNGGVAGKIPIPVMKLEYQYFRDVVENQNSQFLGITDLRFIYIPNFMRQQEGNEPSPNNQSAPDQISQLQAQNETNFFRNETMTDQTIQGPRRKTSNIFDVFRNQSNNDSNESSSSKEKSQEDLEKIVKGEEFEENEDNSGELIGRKRIKKN